jgi:hypothetical protein
MVSDPELMTRMNVDPDASLKQQSAWLQKMRESGLVTRRRAAAAEQQKKQEPGANNRGRPKSRSTPHSEPRGVAHCNRCTEREAGSVRDG